ARYGPGSIHPTPLFEKGGVARELMRRERTFLADRHSSGTLVRHLRTSPGVATGQRSPNPLPVGRQCRWLRADPSSCISDSYAILSSRARVGVAGWVLAQASLAGCWLDLVLRSVFVV